MFSGIGGFSLGLERTGMETVAFCEYDEKCRQVLTKHWPDVTQYTDVRTLTGEQLERDGITDIGLICGGYPCQSFSLAGNRSGEEDDRHLWPEIFRLIKEIRPTWVCCENVAGHITMGLDSVLADLEGEGYSCQSFVIPACAVGAPHRRDRVWIVAHANEQHDDFRRHGASKILRDRQETSKIFRSEDVADSMHKGLQEREREDPGRKSQNGRPKLERVSQWLPEPPVGRVANGVPGRVDRLKQLGNAVVPQVVEIIGRAIMESHAT